MLAIVVAAASVGAVGCTEDIDSLLAVGTLTAPVEVDFGTVQVGWVDTATLTITNTGEFPIAVLGIEALTPLASDSFEFAIGLERFDVPPLGQVEVPVTFIARSTTAEPEGFTAQVEFKTELYDPKPPFGPRNLQVTLRARPIPPGLEVSPNPVVFGRVFLGGEKTVNVTIRNRVDVPIDVFGDTAEGGGPRWLPTDSGAFSVAPAPSLSDDGRIGSTLAPGASTSLRVTFKPGADEGAQRAGWYLRNCDDAACRVLVRFEGEGSTSAWACEPLGFPFGRVNPGLEATREVSCTNVLSDPVTVTDVSLEGSSAFRVDASGLERTVAPGESITVRVTYRPPVDSLGQSDLATVRLIARDANGNEADPVDLPASGVSGGPRIEVEPTEIDFGLVAIGVPLTRGLVVRNVGVESLFVSELLLAGRDGDAFRVGTAGFSLAPNEARILEVTFDPLRAGPQSALLRIRSNDDQRPEVSVSLAGVSERVAPCLYALTPASIDFGTVFLGTQPIRTIEFTNTGGDACIFNGIEVQSDEVDPPFSLVDAPSTGVRVEPGAIFVLRVRYRPTAEGTNRALVLAQVSNPGDPVAGVPVIGRAEPPLDLGCPPAQSTPAGTPLVLTAGTLDGTSYEWAVISAPNGGTNTPGLWTPDPPIGRSVEFLPFIVGRYVIELTVQTEGGQSLSCRTEVTAEGQGLRVTLTWDGSGDVDLHVHNGLVGSAWFREPEDCHYSNREPLWVPGQPVASGPNPVLDFDNTSGFGPENTSIDVPELSRTYHIGVHHYSLATGRRATIEVFCGGTSVPDASFTSRPLRGADAGRCSSTNDFWRVATVRFSNRGQCTISPIDTYTQTFEACRSL